MSTSFTPGVASLGSTQNSELHLEEGLDQEKSYRLCQAASECARPIFAFLAQGAYCLWTPVMPAEFGQRSAAVEYTHRGLVLTLMVLALMAPPTRGFVGAAITLASAIGSVGMGLKLAASFMNSRDFFSMVQGEPKPLQGNKLSALSANICAFEGGLSWICGGMRPWKQRVCEIVQILTQPLEEQSKEGAFNESPHVIALQEVWSLDVARALIEEFKKKGYTQFFFNMGLRAHAPGSGLFVASRTKISDAEFVPFEDEKFFDIKRGFFVAKIEREGEESLTFVTTHLEPSNDDLKPTEKDKADRKSQLAQILKKVGDASAIICGDLNMQPEELQVGKEGDQTFFAGDISEPTCAQSFDRKIRNQPLVEQLRLDYILTTAALDKSSTRVDGICPLYKKKESQEPSSQKSTDAGFDPDTNTALSDHQGISTLFTLS